MPRDTVLEQERLFVERLQVTSYTATLLDLKAEVSGGGRQIHDANIVATMLAFGIPTLLTHNARDFECFGRWIRITPSA